ncbi:MAG TPA: hypothetical protein G4O07_00540 [Dehalococcoidia bacterium]|nr:hypothetical protein [Dehalococcoidia bacterium]
MGVRLFAEPDLRQPDMLVGWPGIGNIGVITVDAVRQQTAAVQLGDIEPWEFFYPGKVVIRGSVLERMEFPGNKFYFAQLEDKDLLLFIGEEQPSSQGRVYAEGSRAYKMANLVLDVAEKFGCRRIYTSGAAVALTHHELKPRVWAVATDRKVLNEVRGSISSVLRSDIEARGEYGNITGLNGLLAGVARKRGFEGVCLMGEIPDYLSRIPFPYPRASQSVLDVLSLTLGIPINTKALDKMTAQMEDVISNVFLQFPPEVREKIEQRKKDAQSRPGTITDEEEKWLKEHIDEFFRGGEQDQ